MSDYAGAWKRRSRHARACRRAIPEYLRSPLLEASKIQAVFELGSAQGPSRLALHNGLLCGHADLLSRGDIGRLAVNDTVNDLAMSGARPIYLPRDSFWKKVSPLRICRGYLHQCTRRLRSSCPDRDRDHKGRPEGKC